MAGPGTQEQPGPTGLIARLCSVYHNKIAFTHGFIDINIKHCAFYYNRGLHIIITYTL